MPVRSEEPTYDDLVERVAELEDEVALLRAALRDLMRKSRGIPTTPFDVGPDRPEAPEDHHDP